MNYQETLMYSEIMEQPEALHSAGVYNEACLNKLADAIHSKDIVGVMLAGRGTSDHAGIFFKYLCETVWGLPVSYSAPSVLSLYHGKLLLKNMLVIGVSQSGKAADVLEVIKRAKADGAITVSITNDESSILATTADFHLFCHAGLEKSVAATKTFTTSCFLLAKIVEKVTGDGQLKTDLEKVPEIVRDSLGRVAEIADSSSRFVSAKDCYILGRGIVYGVVLETALKLQETTYIRAKAFASSDFHHGPFAVVDQGTKIILIATNDESLADSMEMAEKLKGVDADITVISNSDKISGNSQIAFTKNVSRYTSLFAIAPIVQLFACTLSVARGLNPDCPRGLKKVTITK